MLSPEAMLPKWSLMLTTIAYITSKIVITVTKRAVALKVSDIMWKTIKKACRGREK
jgi:hypothetical protein